jgi:hypothetical protein
VLDSECSLPGLAPRPFRILLAPTLGKRSGAALILAPEFLDLPSQVLNLPLQVEDQADKIVSTEGVQIRHKNIMVRLCFQCLQLLNPVAGFHGRLPLINYVRRYRLYWHKCAKELCVCLFGPDVHP